MDLKPNLSEAQQKLRGINEFKAVIMAEQVKECVKAINVTDIDGPGPAEIVKNSVQQLKKTAKDVGNLRKEYTAPLDQQKKAYMALEKTVVAPLNSAIETANKKIQDYLKEQQKKAAAEQAKLEAKQSEKTAFVDALTGVINEYFKDINSAIHQKSMKALNAAYKHSLAKDKENPGKIWKVAKAFKRKEEPQIANQAMVSAGKYARTYIKEEAISKEAAKEKVQSIYDSLMDRLSLASVDIGEVEEAQIQESKKTQKAAAKGTYSVIDFEVENIGKVPKEFLILTIDKEKVKEYIRKNKAKIENGNQDVPGIRFSVETKIRG